MKEQDYEQLTLFREDSHANRSVLPGDTVARKMTVISGRKCSELYERSGPLGCLVRMCLESSIWHSTRCFLTWKRKVTKFRRSLFQLAASTPRTDANASQLWPTPQLNGLACGRKTLNRMVKRGLITEEFYRQVTAGNGGKINPEFLEWLMGYEQQFTKLIPTPTQTDYRGGILGRYWTNSHSVQVERERERESRKRGYDGLLRTLAEVTPLGRIGYLNPNWIEWLMGYPIGWTELNVSETPSYRSSSTPSSQQSQK